MTLFRKKFDIVPKAVDFVLKNWCNTIELLPNVNQGFNDIIKYDVALSGKNVAVVSEYNH